MIQNHIKGPKKSYHIKMTKRLIALKRLSNDMREMSQSPLEGIGIVPMEANPMQFLVNIELMCGPYKGYKVQLEMTMSDDYPIKPPKVLICPRQEIGGNYHHHIFSGNNGYKTFCIDLLENRFSMDTNAEHTGWNPAYTISSILLQVQNFISDPDLHHEPSQSSINKLLKSMDNYRNFIKQGDKEICHTWKEPYPEMYYSVKNEKDKMEEENEIREEKSDNHETLTERRKEFIKENLTCYFLRENYIDNPQILLGYPIIKSVSLYGKDKFEIYPIPQLLTYEAFQMQMSNTQSVNSNSFLIGSLYSMTQVKAANNQYYNNWFPIYVCEEHYLKNKETIINSIKSIKNEAEFSPEQIFEIMPIILNKMIIGMFNGKSIISTSFMSCYFHYVLLFKRLCKDYKEEYDAYVNKKISLITMNDYEVNKKIVADIGDFFMLVFLSNKDMTSPEMIKIRDVLIEEFLIRQMFWTFHGPECAETMKGKVIAVKTKLNDDVYLDLFHKDPNFKMRFLDIFNKELHNKGIYQKVITTIASDRDFKRNYNNNFNYARREAEMRITQSFKRLYNECGTWGRSKLNELIKDNMRFNEFFIEDEKTIRTNLYESFQVEEILKSDDNAHIQDVLKYAYESQRGNQLLLITFLVLNKLEEPGFMKGLEKNFGIYLDVDSFFQNMKAKLRDIKSYKELYDFIGTELGKGKTEAELIVDAYEKAKNKGYIRDPNERLRSNNTFQGGNYGYGFNKGNHYGYRYPNKYNNKW